MNYPGNYGRLFDRGRVFDLERAWSSVDLRKTFVVCSTLERLWSCVFYLRKSLVLCQPEIEFGRVSTGELFAHMFDLRKSLIVCRPEKEFSLCFDLRGSWSCVNTLKTFKKGFDLLLAYGKREMALLSTITFVVRGSLVLFLPHYFYPCPFSPRALP